MVIGKPGTTLGTGLKVPSAMELADALDITVGVYDSLEQFDAPATATGLYMEYSDGTGLIAIKDRSQDKSLPNEAARYFAQEKTLIHELLSATQNIERAL